MPDRRNVYVLIEMNLSLSMAIYVKKSLSRLSNQKLKELLSVFLLKNELGC